MPTFEDYPSSPLIKALLLGDGGSGKTGAQCSLAAAGFTVRILDLDGMALIIKDLVTNPASIYLKANGSLWGADSAKGLAKRISYVTVQESMHVVQQRTVPKADAWPRAMAQLQRWKDGDTDAGSPSEWTERDILVIDSLTRLSAAAWNFQLAMNGRLLGRPEQNDYWQVQQLIRGVMDQLRTLPCHVVVICHIDYIKDSNGVSRGYPETKGPALSLTLPRDFLHILMVRAQGQGQMVSRKIITQSTGTVDLRSPVPLKVKPEYPLETGLAEYFRDVRGKAGP